VLVIRILLWKEVKKECVSLALLSIFAKDCSAMIWPQIFCIAMTDARRLWFAQITVEMPSSSNRTVGVRKYLVGTITTGHFKNRNNIDVVRHVRT
jgi:hypothetical protein